MFAACACAHTAHLITHIYIYIHLITHIGNGATLTNMASGDYEKNTEKNYEQKLETAVSRHHGGTIKSSLKTLRPITALS